MKALKDPLAKKGDLYNQLGRAYAKSSAYQLASENYEKSFLGFQKENDLVGMSLALRNNGLLHLSHKKEYKQAIGFFQRSLRYSHRLKDSATVAHSLNDLGVCHAQLLAYDSAQHFFMKSFHVKLELGDTSSAASTLNNIGELLATREKYDSAFEFYRKSLALCKNDSWGYAYVQHNLAGLFLEQSAIDSASFYLKLSEELCKANHFHDILKLNYDSYVRLFSQTNDLKNIKKYTQLSAAISDSLVNKESLEMLAAMQAKYETRLKNEENKRLEAENGLYAQLLATKDFKIKALVLVLLLVLVASSIILLQNRTQRRANKALVKKNLEVVQREQQLSQSLANSEAEKPKRDAGIPDEQKERVFAQISEYIQKEKPHLSTDFTLQELANKIGSNRSYVSSVINEKLDISFTTMVNNYRIEEARRMLSNPDHHNLTIEAIGQAVGFNSRSAFNTAFKRYSGVTPSYYLKSVKSMK